MNWMFLVLFFHSIIFAQSQWLGKTAHYILDGGSGDGSAWNNALDALPSTLIRDNVYYIGDGSYSSYTFNDAVSGTDTIFIVKATESDHGTETGWSSAYGDGIGNFTGQLTFSTSYWFMSGQQRTTWTTGYGLKITTTSTKGITQGNTDNMTNLVFQYLEIEGQGDDGADGSNDLFYQNSDGSSNTKFQYCYLHDAGRTHFLIRDFDDFLVEYCYMKKNESVSAQHSEPISAGNRAGLGNNDCVIRWNIWEDCEGTGFIVFRGDNWQIYGNLVFNSRSSNGGFTTWSTDPDEASVTNAKVYNNTIVDCNGINSGTSFDKIGSFPSGNVHYNNLFYNCDNVINNGCTSDYNAFESSEGELNEQIINSSIFTNYAGDDFTLGAATDNGKDDLGSPYNLDINGDTRGADGTWDRGYDEFGTAGHNRPNTVKNVRIIPVSNN